jgi:hypothetical protein
MKKELLLMFLFLPFHARAQQIQAPFGKSCALHSRQRSGAFEDSLQKLRSLERIAIFRLGEVEVENQDMNRLKSGIDVPQVPKAFEEEPCTNQEHKGKCYFCGDECIAQLLS